ncbi:hypothetical protein KCU65_g1600, partial [Aureobasidium melanogenum]
MAKETTRCLTRISVPRIANIRSRPGQDSPETCVNAGLRRTVLALPPELSVCAINHFLNTAAIRTCGMSAPNDTNPANNQNNPNPDTNNTTAKWRHMRLDPNGVINICRDGVLRSLNADHTIVLDYRRLSPEEIQDYIALADQATKDALFGVDGRDVTDEAQLWAVPAVNLPAADESRRDGKNHTTEKRPWRRDPEGVSHLGRDGVLRSLNADRTAVLDVRRLSPAEIKEFAGPFGQATVDALVGVDGRDVTDEAQLWAVPIVNTVADESKIYKPAVPAQGTASAESSGSQAT